LLTPESDELVSTKKNSLSLHQALLESKTPSKVVAVKGTDHITVLGTLSPVLFFKGDSLGPIQNFVQNLPNQSLELATDNLSPTSTHKNKANLPSSEALHDLTTLPAVEGVISDILKPIPMCKS
jgi:hypothetical protein